MLEHCAGATRELCGSAGLSDHSVPRVPHVRNVGNGRAHVAGFRRGSPESVGTERSARWGFVAVRRALGEDVQSDVLAWEIARNSPFVRSQAAGHGPVLACLGPGSGSWFQQPVVRAATNGSCLLVSSSVGHLPTRLLSPPTPPLQASAGRWGPPGEQSQAESSSWGSRLTSWGQVPRGRGSGW